MNKFIRKVNQKEFELIASTPQKECWICDYIINNAIKSDKGFILRGLDEGMTEHVKQIIRR